VKTFMLIVNAGLLFIFRCVVQDSSLLYYGCCNCYFLSSFILLTGDTLRLTSMDWDRTRPIKTFIQYINENQSRTCLRSQNCYTITKQTKEITFSSMEVLLIFSVSRFFAIIYRKKYDKTQTQQAEHLGCLFQTTKEAKVGN
jgi:hypothetical protein